MDRFCTICSFQPKTYAGLAKHTAGYRKVHVYAADGLSSTVIVYNHIEKDKNADLAIANSISDALDMCEVLFQTYDRRLAGELATAESVTAKDSNYVDTFGSDFAFSFANILSLIAFIISYRLFADELVYAPNRATVVPIIILVDKIQLSLILGDVAAYTLLAEFIPTTKIRDPLLKSQVYYYCMGKLLSPLKNAAKSGILLACADGRIRQCYLTICAILRCLNKGHDDFVYLVNCFGWKHYNFNIYVSLATDTLHLLLKGLVIKMLDFMQDMLDDIYPGSRKTWDNSTTLVTQESEQKAIIQQLVAVVSLLFVLKAPFALHFIRAVCNLVTLAQYKSHNEDTLAYIQGALERMNRRTSIILSSTQYILQICLHNSRRTALLAADYATVVKQSRLSTTLIPGIQPHLTKLPLSEVAANIAISNFIYAAAVFQSFGKRHNDPKHCDEEVINNTTGMLSVRRRAWNAAPKRQTLQAFKFYDLSTIIRLVHLVLRDLPNSITCTTISYYVNNYID
ncbi:hypothetical protein HBI51_104240 [Parastagonospora nodorum]|nr:hypothetical protein HBI51_104240 [Parastagonospora nodorum]